MKSKDGYYFNGAPAHLLEDDALSILAACYRHRGEYQSQSLIGEWSGTSQQRVSEILNSEDEWGPEYSVLNQVAYRYGFSFRRYRNRKGLLIDVYEAGLYYRGLDEPVPSVMHFTGIYR